MEADRSLFLLLLFRERHAFESSCELLLNYNGILLQGGGPSITLRKKKKKKHHGRQLFRSRARNSALTLV